MGTETNRLHDPGFRALLARRSKWRWGLSAIVLGAYVVYAVGGVYFPQAYGRPFLGSSIPWGLVVGYLIIALAIVVSLVYVRVINRLETTDRADRETHG